MGISSLVLKNQLNTLKHQKFGLIIRMTGMHFPMYYLQQTTENYHHQRVHGQLLRHGGWVAEPVEGSAGLPELLITKNHEQGLSYCKYWETIKILLLLRKNIFYERILLLFLLHFPAAQVGDCA